jgi:hypothetical protein
MCFFPQLVPDVRLKSYQKLGKINFKTSSTHFLHCYRAMDCEACKSKITAISNVAQTADAVKTAVDFFNGPDYCTAQVSNYLSKSKQLPLPVKAEL